MLDGETKKRPIGVIILAGLHFLAGLVMTLMLVNFLSEAFASDFGGLVLFFAVFTTVAVIAVNFCAGAGMLMGRKWGWALSFTVVAFLVLQQLQGLLMVPVMEQVRPAKEVNAAISSLVIVVLLLLFIGYYYFRRNVAEFFEMDAAGRTRLAVWSAVAALTYFVLDMALRVYVAMSAAPS